MDMEKYIVEYMMFMDTCTILESPIKLENLFRKLYFRLSSNNKKINIPLRVIEEIEKHYQNKDNLSLSIKAKQAYELLVKWQQKGIIEICGSKEDNFADNAFLTAFTALRVKHKLLLITQDKNLATDILKLNDSAAVRGKDIDVLRMNNRGILEHFPSLIDKWHNQENLTTSSELENKGRSMGGSSEKNSFVNPEEKFLWKDAVTSLSDAPLSVANIPEAGETVYTQDNRKITLGKRLAAGGEGSVYGVDNQLVAKIYKSGKITKRKQAKLELLTSKGISCPGICLPEKLLYNSARQFVGYLMPVAKGFELQKSVFIKPLFIKKFPHWRKLELVRLALTILEKFKYLHDRNILVGDINGNNILVQSPEEIYMVDTDSFQIEDYPCPVGTNLFTAREIQGIHFEEKLRTQDNENYAIAVLLFMLMLPGKPPYAHQGGEGIVENIRQQKFPYPLKYISGTNVPEGQWRFIWSHLTFKIKEAFYETFAKGGKYSEVGCRLSVDKWIILFREYEKNLLNGNLGTVDKMSEELFPDRLKKERWAIYEPCMICGKEAKKKWGSEYHICYECSQEIIATRKCVECGKEFQITQGEKLFRESKGRPLPDLCKNCRDRKKYRFF